MGISYQQALTLVGADVPAHLGADAEVPVLSGAQAQGDLLVFPQPAPDGIDWERVPGDGVTVVRGEATGNTHWLHRGFSSPDVMWSPWSRWTAHEELTVGYLRVPPGQSALLIHTDEHGANGIGPGDYAIHRKREWDADQARMLAD